jgi:hypothetical protein
LKTREKELAVIESRLENRKAYPDYWRRDLRAYRSILLESISKPSFLLPMEFKNGRTIAQGYDELRRFVASAGELYTEWPALWANAGKPLRSFRRRR